MGVGVPRACVLLLCDGESVRLRGRRWEAGYLCFEYANVQPAAILNSQPNALQPVVAFQIGGARISDTDPGIFISVSCDTQKVGEVNARCVYMRVCVRVCVCVCVGIGE